MASAVMSYGYGTVAVSIEKWAGGIILVAGRVKIQDQKGGHGG
ncbi:hypothetical protein [Saezia sanguinis]|nr:hypothetical protein [Saezia sanguinis]